MVKSRSSSQPAEPLRWFVTGASSGLGAAVARVALDRGDHVIATARDAARVIAQDEDRMQAWSLDLSDRDTRAASMAGICRDHPDVDVVVANAGYGLLGAFEETADHEIREAFEVNLFGALDVIRAYLPGMRDRGWGRIVVMSSVVGVTSGAGGSGYAGPKAALEAVADALGAEVEPFGVDVMIVEPGAFRTDFGGRSLRLARPIDAYESSVGIARDAFVAGHGSQRGDPTRAAQIIVDAALSSSVPRRLPLGPDAVAVLRNHYADRTAEVDAWEAPATATDFR
nr:SDR family NAD(P)-dependent oxidoreductase [Williamsia sp.]